MKRFAVIDVGSNSVRLLFVANGKVLYKTLNSTRLGEGLAEKPILKTEAIERTALAVAKFYERAVEEGAELVSVFATAAARSAKNRSQFTARVKELCGADVDVISGEEEAEIGILGALGAKDGGLIDMGGASTEIIVKNAGSIIYKKSVDIGIVRLKDKCGRNRSLLEEEGLRAVKEYGEVPLKGTLTAVGGTATTVAALLLGLKEYDSSKVNGAEITLSQMQAIAEKLLQTPVEEVAKMPCVSKGREDLLAGGAALFATLMRELGFEKLIVSDRDNLEGYAIKRGWME